MVRKSMRSLPSAGKPRTVQIVDKPGKGGSRRTGARTLLLKLSETETIWILSISSKYSRDDVEDANRVKEDNELYARLTTGKSLERKRYAAETQTPHRMEKSKGTMTAEIVKVDSFVNASAWDLYDTYVELLVGDQSEAEKEFQKLIDALLKAKGVGLSPDVPFSGVPFEEQVKKLFAQDNFKYALLVTERLLASNRFQTEQSLFKKCIRNKYEDAEQTAFKYEARELWRCKRKSGEATPLSVTAMDWNPADADMLAAGYGDLNRANESCGKVCVWSSKNPVHPERELHFRHPVTAVAFSRTWPNILAVACRNGDLHVADVSADGGTARTIGRDKIRCRHGSLWKIEWIANGSLAEKPEELLAVGEGGIFMRYTFPDDGESSALLQLNYMSTVETLYARRANKPEATKQTREISKVKKVFVKHNFSGLWFSVASDGKTCYISTKEGVVIKVKMSFNCRMDDVFPAHNGPVYNVEVSPFTDLIYFTSGADWCLRIWMEGIPEPLITLKLKSSVASAKWSPSIATLIGLVSEAEFSLWDIARSVFLPSRVVRFEGEDFSTLLFSPSGTNVVLGDGGGLIRVLHLSQLPRQPFLQKEALVAAIKKGLFNNEDLHAKFKRQAEVNRKLLKTEIRVPPE